VVLSAIRLRILVDGLLTRTAAQRLERHHDENAMFHGLHEARSRQGKGKDGELQRTFISLAVTAGGGGLTAAASGATSGASGATSGASGAASGASGATSTAGAAGFSK